MYIIGAVTENPIIEKNSSRVKNIMERISNVLDRKEKNATKYQV